MIQKIYSELRNNRFNIKPKAPVTWRGADFFIAETKDHPACQPGDKQIVHPDAPDVIATLDRAIDLMCADPVIDYNYLSKYELIGTLIEELPAVDANKEILRRLLAIALEAHGRNLYFAYGSNMDLEQMAIRCPDAIALGTTRVDGYEFLINSRGVASIRPKPGAHVEGVVFALTPECNAALDRYEGVRWNTYSRETIRDELGLECLVYLASDQTPTPGNDSPYLRRIIAAAERFNLSPDTIEAVRRFF